MRWCSFNHVIEIHLCKFAIILGFHGCIDAKGMRKASVKSEVQRDGE